MTSNDENYGMRQGEVLFSNIDGDQSVTEIQSLCMNCHENVAAFVRLCFELFVGNHKTFVDENSTF